MLLFNPCKWDRNWKCLIQSHICRKFISWLALLSVCHELMFAKRLWNASLHHIFWLIYIVYTAKTSLRTEIPRDTHTRTRTVLNWKIIVSLQELKKYNFNRTLSGAQAEFYTFIISNFDPKLLHSTIILPTMQTNNRQTHKFKNFTTLQ